MTNRLRRSAPVSDDAVRDAVREAARIVAEYSTGSSVGEVADCAADQLAETLALLDPEDLADAEALVVRATFAAAGLDRASSDSSAIDQPTLVRMATPPPAPDPDDDGPWCYCGHTPESHVGGRCHGCEDNAEDDDLSPDHDLEVDPDSLDPEWRRYARETEARAERECGVDVEFGPREDPYGTSCDLDRGHAGPHEGDHPMGGVGERMAWEGGGSAAGDRLPVKLVDVPAVRTPEDALAVVQSFIEADAEYQRDGRPDLATALDVLGRALDGEVR